MSELYIFDTTHCNKCGSLVLVSRELSEWQQLAIVVDALRNADIAHASAIIAMADDLPRDFGLWPVKIMRDRGKTPDAEVLSLARSALRRLESGY